MLNSKKVLAELKKGMESFMAFVNGLTTNEEKAQAVAIAFPPVQQEKKEKSETGKAVKNSVWAEFSRGYCGIKKLASDTETDAKAYFNMLTDTEKENLLGYVSPVKGFGSVIQYRFYKAAPWLVYFKLEKASDTNYRTAVFNAKTGQVTLVQPDWCTDVYTNYMEEKAKKSSVYSEQQKEHVSAGAKAALEYCQLVTMLEKPTETKKEA